MLMRVIRTGRVGRLPMFSFAIELPSAQEQRLHSRAWHDRFRGANPGPNPQATSVTNTKRSSATSKTGIRNRALLTLFYRSGLRIAEALARLAGRSLVEAGQRLRTAVEPGRLPIGDLLKDAAGRLRAVDAADTAAVLLAARTASPSSPRCAQLTEQAPQH